MLPTTKNRNREFYSDRPKRPNFFKILYYHLLYNTTLKQFIFLVVFTPPLLIFGYRIYDKYKPVTQSDIKVISLDVDSDITDESQGKWSINQWKYYQKIDSIVSKYGVTSEDIMHGRLSHDPDETQGFWILGREINADSSGGNGNKEEWSNLMYSNQNDNNYIRVQNFQYVPSINVNTGLNLYIEGEASLEVIFWYGKRKHSKETIRISTNRRFFSYGFCNELSFPLYNSNIHEIEIKGILRGPSSYIVIDKIAVAVAQGDRSRNLIYTMMPNYWCRTIGKKINPIL